MDNNDYLARNNHGHGRHSASSRQRPDRPQAPSHQHTSNRSNSQPPSRGGQHSTELVPYNRGRDNDGFGRDDLESYDRWERISADSISL